MNPVTAFIHRLSDTSPRAETSRIEETVSLLRRDPQRGAMGLKSLLNREAVEELIEHCRALASEDKCRGLATGLAHLYCPGRPRAYYLEPSPLELEHDHFHYIASSPELFIAFMSRHGLLDMGGRFLDVGAGLGEKVFLAHALGQFTACDGIEYRDKTVAVAEFLLYNTLGDAEHSSLRVFQGDALSFDRYHEYECIYMYRPIRSVEYTARLIARICAQLREGAVMFDLYKPGAIATRIGEDWFMPDPAADANRELSKRVSLDELIAVFSEQ